MRCRRSTLVRLDALPMRCRKDRKAGIDESWTDRFHGPDRLSSLEPKITQELKKTLGGRRGAIGIGTLIVFIAMILVAAVAAVVLIRTSGVLEQKAYDVGMSSTEEASNKMNIIAMTGNSTAPHCINELIITLRPSGGSSPIDMTATRITFQSSSYYVSGIPIVNETLIANKTALIYGDNTTKVAWITHSQGDYDTVLESTENDLLEIHYALTDGVQQRVMGEHQTMMISLIPMRGPPADMVITTPPSIDQTYIALYP